MSLAVVGLGLAIQVGYAYFKGFVLWGHPNGGVGSMMFGQPYNKIYRKTEPQRYWMLLSVQLVLAFAFLAAAAFAYFAFDA